jgi:ribosomal protein S18 acetylase RimI-like enzyme
VQALIRDYGQADQSQVIDLSLRAWEPVHESMERVMGQAIFRLLYEGGWRRLQEDAVVETLNDEQTKVWVAEVGGRVVGFVSAVSRTTRGEVSLLAVDPDHQGGGIGTALTETATEWLRESGMQIAWLETGGDSGHAAGRRTYEKAGYTLMPIARYFKAL